MRVALPKLPNALTHWTIPAIALGLMFVSLILLEMHQVSKDNLSAFNTYYSAGLRMRHGRNPYGPMGIYPYVYPPFYAFVCQYNAERICHASRRHGSGQSLSTPQSCSSRSCSRPPAWSGGLVLNAMAPLFSGLR